LLAIAAFLVTSCLNNADRQPPGIVFLSPSATVTILVPDTIVVQAVVMDDRDIEYVNLSLMDAENRIVVNAASFQPSLREFNLLAEVPVTDIRLPGGEYSLVITADDGHNRNARSIPVVVREAEQQLTGFIALVASNGLSTDVISLTPTFAQDTMFSIPDGHLYSGFNSLEQQFIFCSDEPSAVTAFRFPTFSNDFGYLAEPPFPVFTGLLSRDQTIVSSANGDAIILNGSGGVVMRTEITAERRWKTLAADDEYLFGVLVSLDEASRDLSVYYRNSGQIRFRKSIPDDVVSIFPNDDEHKAIIFSNRNRTTVISLYNPADNSLQELKAMAETTLYFVLKMAPDHFLLFFQEKISDYNPFTGLITPVINDSYLSGVYDPLSRRLYFWESKTLDTYDSQNFLKTESREFEKPISAFHITYNK
jgi:hypothetical protein